MDPTLRKRRQREAAIEGRRRAGVAIVLALAAHLVGVPALALLFTLHGSRSLPRREEKVEFVQIPAAQWDAVMQGATGKGPKPQGPRPPAEARPAPEKKEEPPEEKKPERPPGQVVETAPGNGEEAPDAKLAAETSNRVEKETIARDRAPGQKVTMPQRTTTQKVEEPPPVAPGDRPGDGLALGEAGSGREAKEGPAGSRLEIPTVEKQSEVKVKPSPDGAGSVRNRKASEAVQGNSDRFRVQVGEGEGDGEAGGAAGPAGSGGKPLHLFPSRAELAQITGGPAPDHVEGMEEGDGTFLNTREWKYASFFNRVKRNVAETWDPISALRKRDPTGQIYAFKDRHTLLSITLDAEGRISDVHVEKSSGLDFLDHEAIAAFMRAQPFPNPPKGLVDERGAIQFQFGFYLELGRPGFRLFR
mgnify:CR=1 FL=1